MRCIEYDGHITKSGYGLDYDPDTKKTISAHRLAFKKANNYLPKVVMHSCDNPRCVNPSHLVAGTQSDNIKDCIAKKRYISRRKLTNQQVQEIRESKLSTRVLGDLYGVHQTTVCNVRKRDYIYGS